MTGAVFGVAQLRNRPQGRCFVKEYRFRRYCIVARIRGMSFGLLCLRVCHCDLHVTVCLPCMNFVAGAALWRCFMRLVFTSKTIIFRCHSHSCAYGILYNSMLPSSRHVAHAHTSYQTRSHHNDGWWPCVLIGFLSLKFPPLPACPGTTGMI